MEDINHNEPKPMIIASQGPKIPAWVKVILPILIIMTIAVALKYTNFFPRDWNFNKSAPSPTPAIFNNVINKLIFACPVEKQACKERLIVYIDGYQAVSFKVASNSALYNSTGVFGKSDILEFQNSSQKTKTIITASKIDNDCYITSYKFSFASKIADINRAPIQREEVLATINGSILTPDQKEVSLIMSVRKTSKNKETSCVLWDNPERESAPFQPMDQIIFY